MVSRLVKRSVGKVPAYPLVGLFITLLLLGGGTVRADEWVYTFRPGDTLWVLCNTYVAEPDCWNKVALRNEIVNPRRISPGTKLYLPIAWLKVQPAKVKVLTVEGGAVIALDDGKFKVIEKGDTFSVGDHLYSREGSFLLEFSDGSQLMVKAGSEVLFDTLTLYGDSGMVDTRIRLNRGRVRAKVTPSKGRGSRYEIVTPAAAAAVRGTIFRVSSAEGEIPAMTTEVLEGNVNVGNEQGDQSVEAGYAVKAEKGKAVLSPQALLPAPTLTSEVEERLADVVSVFPLELEWQSVDGANAYRLELFILEGGVEGDVKGEERFVLEDKLIVTHKALSLLKEGRYKINVRAIDNNEFEGVDKTVEFVVLSPREVVAKVQDERWWPYVFGSALLAFLIF